MNVEILAVGTELLLGDILNSNAQYLSKELANLGMAVYFQTVVGDNPSRLKQALATAFERSDMVITTGGLGPTKDDLTKEIAAEFFQKELILHEETLERIAAFFRSQSLKMAEGNRKQAYIPQGCIVLPNDNGTAPGIIIEEEGKILVLLPGPPPENNPMFENYVVPHLRSKTKGVFFSRVLRVCGVGESMVENMLEDIIHNQTNPSIAPYAKIFEVHLRITASASNEEEAKQMIEPVAATIRERLADNVYGEGDTTLEAVVAQLLIDNKYTIACAESCTGGMLTSRLVDFSGVSQVLLESAITYSNEAKMKRLGVKEQTLEKFGAVSSETAAEMAAGIARASGSNVGIAVTGIAGPNGGTKEKPVGLVYFGLFVNGKITTKECMFHGDRIKIRSRAVAGALDYVRRALLKS